MNIIEYDESGRIQSVVTYFEARSIIDELYPGRLVLSDDRVVSQYNDYVNANELLPRPVLPVSMTGALLRGVPAGAKVWVDEQSYLADGTDIELQIEHEGHYRIRVESWPFMDFETVYEN